MILPQAIRRVIPPLLNDFIGLQKDTALVGTIGVIEAFHQSQIDSAATFTYGAYLAAAVLFVALTIPLARLTDWLIARDRSAPGARGGVSASALRLEGVRKSFGGNEVLQGIDLEVGEHEVVCLIGASGSGKSTLLRCVNLLEPVDEGRIVLGGRGDHRAGSPGQRRPAADRDRLPVLQPLPAHERAAQRHARPARRARALAGRRPTTRRRRYSERFGLADKRDEYPDRLSGGQQQRVAIVRALAMQPELMLLDEVTSALDPELVAEVLNVIRELAEGGMTMLIATHEMSFARDIASRVCFLDAGLILEEGPPSEILARPKEPRTQQFLERIIEAGRL